MKIPSLAAKIKTTVLIACSLLGVYAVLGYYVLPTLVKAKLPELIRQQTGRKASLATVRFDPFSLRLSLHGFALQDPDARRFVGFDDLFIELNARQSIGQAAL
ncbi:MAG: membrane biogenesis protein, partial [Methylococcaceae bacterium]